MDIVACGMVSSLGHDVASACAAARAGLARPTELPFVVAEADGSPGLATGHPVPLLGGAFEGDARLIRLLEGAFRDLARQLAPDVLTTGKLGVYLSLPASDRLYTGLDLIPGEDDRMAYLESLPDRPHVDELVRGKKVIATAMRLADVTASPVSVAVSTTGNAGVIAMYEVARQELDSRVVDHAVVGGVDSLLAPPTLRWLQTIGRLKSAERPTGLAPGEAAALSLVSSPSQRARTGQSTHGCIRQITRASCPTSFLSGQPARGTGQFQVLYALTQRVGETPWVIVDQNGEEHRASDWGNALIRLHAKAEASAAPLLWFPAVAFGDTGGAAGAVATCMAVRAHVRGYAPSPHAIVLTSSDGPDRAGCLVSAREE
jgi:hypothetical protein